MRFGEKAKRGAVGRAEMAEMRSGPFREVVARRVLTLLLSTIESSMLVRLGIVVPGATGKEAGGRAAMRGWVRREALALLRTVAGARLLLPATTESGV